MWLGEKVDQAFVQERALHEPGWNFLSRGSLSELSVFIIGFDTVNNKSQFFGTKRNQCSIMVCSNVEPNFTAR